MKNSLLIIAQALVPQLCIGLFSPAIGQGAAIIAAHATTTLPDTNDRYPGCFFKGNYIYAAAVNLVWNVVKDNVLGEPLRLKTADRSVLKFTELMNAGPFSKNDLDAQSCYVKSGLGQKTVETINKEVNKKFPENTIAALNVTVPPSALVAYAYIFKNVRYENAFDPEDNFYFNNEKVLGFFAKTEAQKSNIVVLKYQSDDTFIVRIQLKDPGDELIAAKGYNQKNSIEALSALSSSGDTIRGLSTSDVFGMPEVHFLYDHSFSDLARAVIDNKKFHGAPIDLFEKVKFDLDFNGVRLENKAAMVVGMGMPPASIKRLILDKPFWLIMRRKGRANPYVILGVNNTEIMTKTRPDR